ncbi:lipoxygenase [Podospora didyma]|uniref:Manganese lipoxygenase n=1 Tax=Podospora didyma TaxID=330526 RepID=A0AAE0N3Q7_9PEZI|nr:lipoxygenase [Podospora didyma]
MALLESFRGKDRGGLDANLPTPSQAAAARPTDRTILKYLCEKEYFAQLAPQAVDEVPGPSFDPGVFDNELLNLKLYSTADTATIVEGTYMGTQVALTQVYARIEQTFSSLYDFIGIEPSLPRYITLEEQRKIYKFTAYPNKAHGTPADYPPHLQIVPQDQTFEITDIYDRYGIFQTQILLQKITPDEDRFLGRTKQWLLEQGLKIQQVEEYNKGHRKFGSDITCGSPIDPSSLWVQDGSFLRKAAGVSDPEAVLNHRQPASDENWAVGSVGLFQLYEDGKLHPIAICVDHKGSMEISLTIFNKRMTPSDSTSGEKDDWPWGYAKTAAQVTDWMRHELSVHLTLSHFVEEAIITATSCTIPMDHAVYRLLSPQWYKTLSLNAAARASLVPQVVADIIGLSPAQAYRVVRHAYDSYNFVESYVPNDLSRRGFPNTQEGLKHPRYNNCQYAKNMLAMWDTLQAYVMSMVLVSFPTDESAKENQTAAYLSSFPDAKTIDTLTDVITMCIHIAAPYHSATNYLPNFYQVSVPAKPPALCHAPPTTSEELKTFKVGDDRSLLNYAASRYRVYKYKKSSRTNQKIKEISQTLYTDLQALQKTFYYNSVAMEKGSILYTVLDPGLVAVSILM